MADIDTERARLKAALETLDKERRVLEDKLLEDAEANGIQRMTVNGRTVYVRSELWAAAAVDRDDAVAALKAAGLGSLVNETYNAQTLSAWVRNELPQTPDGMPILPDDLVEHIKVASKTSIRSNTSS